MGSFTAELAEQADPEIGRELIRVRHDDGRVEELRLHDYERLYALPGVYEQIVQDRLGCRSPTELAGMLAQAVDAVGLGARSCARARHRRRQRDLGRGAGGGGPASRAGHRHRPGGARGRPARSPRPLRAVPDARSAPPVRGRPDGRIRARRQRAELRCPGGRHGSELPPAALVAAAGLLAPDALVVYMHDPHRAVPDAVTPELWKAGLGAGSDAQELERRRYVHRRTVNGAPFHMDGVLWRLRRAAQAQ